MFTRLAPANSVGFAIVFVVVAATLQCASNPAKAQPLRIEIQEVELEGTILTINQAQPSLLVQTPQGQYAVDLVNRGINIPPAKVTFNGDRSVEFLKPDMFVRFEAEVSNRRKVVGEVAEIHVVGPSPSPAFGFTPIARFDEDDVAEAADAEAEDHEEERYIVVGRVKRMFGDEAVLVETPDNGRARSLRVELTADAKVQLADISFAKRGDRVLVKGEQQAAARGRFIWAKEVVISQPKDLDELLGDDKPIADKMPDVPDPFAAAAEDPEIAAPTKPRLKGSILKIN